MRYDAEDGDIQMVLTGDSLITRRMSVFKEPYFLALVEILRRADVAITNAEMLFHDYESSPAVVPGGTYMRADPQIIDELQWMGINLLAVANNHQNDFGENGLAIHLDHLRRSGITYAGIGQTMGEAREPHYLDTSVGRVALISCTSSGAATLLAGHQWRDGKGRPGTNMIRHTSQFTVDEQVFLALRKLRDELNLDKRRKGGRSRGFSDHSWGMTDIPDSDTEFYMGNLHTDFQGVVPQGFRFVLGDRFETHLMPVKEDMDENLQRIRDARRGADWVVVTMHNHEQGLNIDDPSDIAVAFAHAAIDAGADVFHGHGPHRDRGIEIYKGKPIFYSIGHFINQNETVTRVPLENMRRQGCDPWEGVPNDFSDSRAGAEWQGEWIGHANNPAFWRDIIAVVDFKGKALSSVVLQPIDLGLLRPRYQRGRPGIASGTEAQEVLELMQKLSKPFGTSIKIEGEIGKVQLDS